MRRWLWLAPAAVLLLVLAGAEELPGLRAWAAGAPGGKSQAAAAPKETVELAGDTVEYDVNRRVSVVTGGPGGPATLVSGKLTLSGDRLEYAEATGQARVEGGVRLEGSEPDRFVLTARAMTLDLKARTARAQGEVRLVSGKAVATADEAFYQEKERQVALSGKPAVRLEENVLEAKEIVFFLSEQKVRARGGSRVTVPVAEQGGEKGE